MQAGQLYCLHMLLPSIPLCVTIEVPVMLGAEVTAGLLRCRLASTQAGDSARHPLAARQTVLGELDNMDTMWRNKMPLR